MQLVKWTSGHSDASLGHMVEGPVHVVPCGTAHHFVEQLGIAYVGTPRAENRLQPGQWVYRGQADAEWGLVPTALRVKPAPVLFHDGKWTDVPPPNALEQVRAELSTLRRFFWASDVGGVPIPGDSSELRRQLFQPRGVYNETERRDPTAFWPPRDLVSVFALAQHHRLPTRLLDWSRKPQVAAYFAVTGALREKTKELAVWALDVDTLFEYPLSLDDPATPGLEVVLPAPADNANLRAQAGVFTYTPVRLYGSSGRPVGRESVEDMVTRASNRIPNVLRKLVLPTSQARSVLRMLFHEGLTAAAIYPGPNGVVQALADERFIQDE